MAPRAWRRETQASMNSSDWTAQDIKALAGRRIMVIGDLILDRYIWGRAERASPEAPVLVLEYDSEHALLGGAGNVVGNLAAAGALPLACGVVGHDQNGDRIRQMLRDLGATASGVFTDPSRPTIEKSRVMAGNQQILRIDRERRHDLSDATRARLLAWIERNLPKCAGLVLSDYLKGVLSRALIKRVAALCHKQRIMVVADPKGIDYTRYRGVDYITPNQKEVQAASGMAIEGEGLLARAGRKLLAVTKGRGVVVTRGHEETALFLKDGRAIMVATHPREVFDVTGAGDTFISYFALATFAGYGPREAAVLGNLAGGLAVQKIGAVAISSQDVINEVEGFHPARKLKSLQELEIICARLRNEGKRIVICLGSYDLLHAGHIRFLGEARRRGDVLVVGIYTDRMIHELKGEGRPFIELGQRAEILSAMAPVDYIVACDQKAPSHIIDRLRPDVFALGENHPAAEYLFDKSVNPYNGEIHLVPLRADATKAKVIERIFLAQKEAGRR